MYKYDKKALTLAKLFCIIVYNNTDIQNNKISL